MKATVRLVVIAVVSMALGVAVLYAVGVRLADVTHWGQDRNALVMGSDTVRIPPVLGSPERLAPTVIPGVSGEWSFLKVAEGGAVLHDPCVPIRWTVSTERMPPGADDVVREAVAEVATRAGLVWEEVSPIDTSVAFDRAPLVNDDGWQWAPVMIGWSSETESPDLVGNAAGAGGPMVTRGAYGSDEYLRSGTVLLDLADFPTFLTNPSQRARAKLLVMHELGHVVGLDHVSDASELMYPAETFTATWGPGDVAGLAAAGAGKCEQP